jgi:hypothetical protein
MFWWLLVGIDEASGRFCAFEPDMFVYLIRPDGE